MNPAPPTLRLTIGASVALLLSLVLHPAASAQPAALEEGQERWIPHLTGGESTLWLLRIATDRSLVFRRSTTGRFERLEPLNAPVLQAAAGDTQLYAFAEGGAFYALSDKGWLRQHDLPHRMRPLDMVADELGVIALIQSPRAGELPLLPTEARPTTTQPFDPGNAACSLVRYDSRGWSGIAACPAEFSADGPVPPRIAALPNGPTIFWAASDTRRIVCRRYDPQREEWDRPTQTPPIPNLKNFWVTTVGRVPSLLAAYQDGTGGPQLRGYRLFGAPPEEGEWLARELHLSALPASIQPQHYDTAVGFNQHFALLMVDASAGAWVRFARFEPDLAESTVSVADVIDPRNSPSHRRNWIQGLTLLLLFAVLLSMMLFRRGAMMNVAILPPNTVLALTFQRLLGWLIDFGPISLISAAMLGVGWQKGLEELFGWATGSDVAEGRFPEARVLTWWAVSAGVYVVYAVIMELALQRTVGKLLTGTRVLADTGRRPSALQTIIRNVLRLIELMPPLWILGFLVVLSRNRQRMGDIFARTVVVRPLRTAPTREEPGAGPDEDQ